MILPKPENVTTAQQEYIYSQFTSLNAAAQAGNASPSNGFPSIIDIPSFIHFLIIKELTSNADSYSYGTYFHKDRNGKLRAGPVWDSDFTFGNDNVGLERSISMYGKYITLATLVPNSGKIFSIITQI